MEIKMAIETAKKDGNWSIVSNKPTSVAVVFIMPILKMKQSWTSTVRTLSPSGRVMGNLSRRDGVS